jgi:hypothetical protein
MGASRNKPMIFHAWSPIAASICRTGAMTSTPNGQPIPHRRNRYNKDATRTAFAVAHNPLAHPMMHTQASSSPIRQIQCPKYPEYPEYPSSALGTLHTPST